MIKYTLFDYEDKDSIKRFYNFYQKFLLNNFLFFVLGSYQSFIEMLRKNNYCEAVMAYDEMDLGGIIFEYEKDSNLGIIHYLETNNNDFLEQILYDFATYRLNKLAGDFYVESPNIVRGTFKRRKEQPVVAFQHKDEYFLKKLVIPSINDKLKNK